MVVKQPLRPVSCRRLVGADEKLGLPQLRQGTGNEKEQMLLERMELLTSEGPYISQRFRQEVYYI
jgi:hypothetical protein